MATTVKVGRYLMPFFYLQVEKAAKNPDDKKIAQATNLNYKLRFANVASGFNYLTDITATSLNVTPLVGKVESNLSK